MTGPDKVSIGNVSFYKKDVKSYEVKTQGDINFNTVFMKDGTKISFFDNKKVSNASIMIGNDAANEDQKGIKFSNVSLYSLKGTDKKDYYYLSNYDVYSLNLYGDEGNADELKFVYNNSTRNGLTPTKISSYDTDDKITDINLSNQQYVNMNEGMFYRTKDE